MPPSMAESVSLSPILTARGVVAGYSPGVDILKGVDLVLGEGELVGVIGPNGAGKSTLVKALFGLLTVRHGAVELRGEPITNLPRARDGGQGGGLCAADGQRFSSAHGRGEPPHGALSQTRSCGVNAVRGRGGSLPSARRPPGAASRAAFGGERQMLAMGRALIMDPSVLLLDEPSAGLSPANQEMVFERVGEIRTAGVSVVMSSRTPADASR